MAQDPATSAQADPQGNQFPPVLPKIFIIFADHSKIGFPSGIRETGYPEDLSSKT
jgi:hypothetical protein